MNTEGAWAISLEDPQISVPKTITWIVITSIVNVKNNVNCLQNFVVSIKIVPEYYTICWQPLMTKIMDMDLYVVLHLNTCHRNKPVKRKYYQPLIPSIILICWKPLKEIPIKMLTLLN